ncbi:MAG: diaminopimelate decarboxylase [Candidatus Planktophila sp.]|nr:diaminopimelate decarboxylase [Candidatus Planktophila sp.]
MWSSSVTTGVELSLAGITAKTLAKEFGTPTFFIDEADFRERALAWDKALKDSFGPHAGTVYYASKAFICTELARWINELGIGIDVSTGGEMAVALAGGIDPSKIEVHGNNKSIAEIEKAVSVGAESIVIDSLYEIERVAEAAKKASKVQRVLLRITPGIQAHTHESIATAHEDVKFGFSIASGAAWAAIAAVRTQPSLELSGIHAHIGSQIFGHKSFEILSERLIALLAQYRDEFKSELSELDLGGGYGIAYLPGDETVDPAEAMKALAAAVRKNCEMHKLKIPTVSIEPGRAIVGPTMFTLYEVGTVKDVTLENGMHRRYISIDGGMSDNIRPSLYGAEYTTILANRTSTASLVSSRLVGKHCETGDIVIREINLPDDIVPGDLLAVPATGAYGRSMASNYNHVPRPPVVAVKDGKARVIVRRESEADLLRLDI